MKNNTDLDLHFEGANELAKQAMQLANNDSLIAINLLNTASNALNNLTQQETIRQSLANLLRK